MQQRGARIRVRGIVHCEFFLALEILSKRLQEDDVRPPAFRVEQLQPGDVLVGVDRPVNQLFALGEQTRVAGEAMAVEQRQDGMPGAAAGSLVIG